MGALLAFPGIRQLASGSNIDQFTELLRSYRPWTPVISVLFSILETVIPPLPAWPILLANAAIYGLWGGIALSWFGNVCGAIINFWLARSFGRAIVERRMRPDHLELVDQISEKKGFWILFWLRVIPLTSLDVLSFVAGLSKISFQRFLAATTIGLIPGITLYTLFAHDLMRFREYWFRLTVTTVVTLVAYFIFRYRAEIADWWKRRREADS